MKINKISESIEKNILNDPTSSTKNDQSTNLHSNVKLSANVKAALINPERHLEVKGWVKKHNPTAFSWRGEDGESMMHWAFLSNWGLALELKELGLSFDDKDKSGRSPMDWLNDRLWSAVVDPNTNHKLSTGGKERLRKHTEEQILSLWAMGARPSYNEQSFNPGIVWIRAGAWSLLDLLLYDNEHRNKFDGWTKWTPKGGNALHAWILSPNTPKRREFLSRWFENFLTVDNRDEDGRTPLWYAVDAYIASASWRPHLLIVIKELLDKGADVKADDIDGTTPLGLISRDQKGFDASFEPLLKILNFEDNKSL